MNPPNSREKFLVRRLLKACSQCPSEVTRRKQMLLSMYRVSFPFHRISKISGVVFLSCSCSGMFSLKKNLISVFSLEK